MEVQGGEGRGPPRPAEPAPREILTSGQGRSCPSAAGLPGSRLLWPRIPDAPGQQGESSAEGSLPATPWILLEERDVLLVLLELNPGEPLLRGPLSRAGVLRLELGLRLAEDRGPEDTLGCPYAQVLCSQEAWGEFRKE